MSLRSNTCFMRLWKSRTASSSLSMFSGSVSTLTAGTRAPSATAMRTVAATTVRGWFMLILTSRWRVSIAGVLTRGERSGVVRSQGVG